MIGDRLAAQSPDGAQGFQFFVVKDSVINAFAVPGGFVFINYGLILATNSESELASVLATRSRTSPNTISLARSRRRVGSPLRRWPQCWPPSSSALSVMAVDRLSRAASRPRKASPYNSRSTSRETKSRRLTASASATLAGAGFDTQAMGNFFEVLSRQEGLAATYIPQMLVDHPVTTDRIAEARSRAAQFPPRRRRTH